MKKMFLCAILFLALSAPAFAAEGNITIAVSEPSEIVAGDEGFFSVDITNNYLDTDYFSVSVYPPQWISIENGISAFLLGGGQTKTLKIFVSPQADARAAQYVYTINVQKASGEKEKKDVIVSVSQRFRSAIFSTLSLSCSECGDVVKTYASVKNVGNSPIEDGKVTFYLGDYKKTVDVPIFFQGEEKIVSTDFIVSNWAPGTYKISAEFSGPNKEEKSAQFSVPVVKKIITQRNIKRDIFSSTISIVTRNDGNSEQSFEVTSDQISSPFVTLYPKNKPSSITGGVLAWYATLKPGESVTYTYSQVFWPLPVGGIMAVFLAAYGYMLATAIEIRKNILGRGEVLGISLHIKNKGSNTDGVVVRDIVPHGFSVIPAFETAKPIIRKLSEGTELIWRLGTVKKGDEEILHYKIKQAGATANALPPAVLRGKRGMSALQKTSNYVVVPRVAGVQAQKLKVVVQE